MRKFYLLLCCFSVFQWGTAQYYEQEGKDSLSAIIPKLSIKYFPSQLLGHFQSHMVGAEVRLKSHISLEARYGQILDSEVYTYDETYFANKSGFKSSLLVKFYLDGLEDGGVIPSILNYSYSDRNLKPYFGIELFYNQIDFERTRTFELSCGDDCSYFKQATYGIGQKRWGGRIQIGFLSPIAGPLFLDCSAALGYMLFKTDPDSRKPMNYEFQYGYLLDAESDSRLVPAVDLNIKLVFNILR
ncbi:hypothetical protein [Roseivirga sp.]|uniref:hypothetical protein n=1 Tax=Roseivirga sp. TaxID=1964215 RepID=UPI003B5176AF